MKLRNKFEKQVSKQLKRSKVAFTYETEKLTYTLVSSYVPDFIVSLSLDKKIFIECKGYLRPEDKRKLVAVKKQHPLIDLRILFYPFKSQKREIQYTKWAIKNKIPYAIGKIPKEWFEIDDLT